jgi:tetratricopeptide (TPR) repeat protein
LKDREKRVSQNGWGRLDDRLAAAQTPREAALLMALKGEGLARLGCLEEARLQIERARRALAERADAAATCAILVAEALVQHQAGAAAAGRGCLARAVAIARSAGVVEQGAYAQAWVAQFESNAFRLRESLAALGAAIGLTAPQHLRTKARIAVVVASWLASAGDLQRARTWFDAARLYASQEGDTAMQAGVLAHMAAAWTDELRVREFLQPAEPLSTSQVMLLVQSSINFDQVLGVQTLGWCGPIMVADIKSRFGDPAAALDLYETYVDDAEALEQGRYEAGVRADMAGCLVQLGRPAEALEMARRAEAVLHQVSYGDDRAVTLARLAEVYTLLGHFDQGEAHAQRARLELQSLREMRAGVRAELDALLQRSGLSEPWPLEPARRQPEGGAGCFG